jgi:hypothetical protein
MILKIYTDKEMVGADELDVGYILVDDILNVHVVRKCFCTIEEIKKEFGHFRDLTIIATSDSWKKNTEHHNWVVLTITNKNKEVKDPIIFNTFAYICNDNGKTIEKINSKIMR